MLEFYIFTHTILGIYMYRNIVMAIDVNISLCCINVEPKILHLFKDVVIHDLYPDTNYASIGAAFRQRECGVDCFIVFTSYKKSCKVSLLIKWSPTKIIMIKS